MKPYGYAPIEVYLQKQVVDRIWPQGVFFCPLTYTTLLSFLVGIWHPTAHLLEQIWKPQTDKWLLQHYHKDEYSYKLITSLASSNRHIQFLNYDSISLTSSQYSLQKQLRVDGKAETWPLSLHHTKETVKINGNQWL